MITFPEVVRQVRLDLPVRPEPVSWQVSFRMTPEASKPNSHGYIRGRQEAK